MDATPVEVAKQDPLEVVSVPDPQVAEKASRRRFTAAYKLDILQQAEACTVPGEVGALLRREGLYSSLLVTWRRQRETRGLVGLEPKKRGRKGHPLDPLAARVAELEGENRRLRTKLQQAETIIEVQKKLSTILGLCSEEPMPPGAEQR